MAFTSQEIEQHIIQVKEAFDKKEYNLAITILHTIIEKNPDYAPAYRELGSILTLSDTPRNALTYLEKAIELAPDNLIYLWEYAKLLALLKETKKALSVYDILVSSGKREIPIEAISEWLRMTNEHGSLDINIRDKVESLSLSNPSHPMLKFLYAQSCVAKLEKEKALVLFDEVYSMEPDNIIMLQKLSQAYIILGLEKKAEEYRQKILKIEPFHFDTLIAASQNHIFSHGDSLFRKLNFIQAHFSELSLEQRTSLHFALGKAYDNIGDLATAFEHYKLGGISHIQDNQSIDYHITKNYRILTEKYLTKEFYKEEKGKGCQSNKPIFILGMPRSGTSLIEQVLSGIDGIYGAGELTYSLDVLNQIEVNQHKFDFTNKRALSHNNPNPNYRERGEHYIQLIEALAPEGSRRIIDKLPDNFKLLGFLYLILPNAKFIHSRRHPVEICLSAYRVQFAEGLYWSDDLATMGKYYREYHEQMIYWKRILPEGSILDVHYENMVTNLKSESKRLTEYIGVPWDSSCLEFHKNERAVRTASLFQVRQPLYKTSINRWRKYEPYLKPLLDEIGDLVEAYEA